jgi:hypothetical protein
VHCPETTRRKDNVGLRRQSPAIQFARPGTTETKLNTKSLVALRPRTIYLRLNARPPFHDLCVEGKTLDIRRTGDWNLAAVPQAAPLSPFLFSVLSADTVWTADHLSLA